jgi:hypothetical protein
MPVYAAPDGGGQRWQRERPWPLQHAIDHLNETADGLWEHVGGPDSDEYVSTGEFPGAGPARGSFLARRPYTRLITHQFLEDLQSDNELARVDLSGQPAGWSSASPTRARASARR